MAFVFALILLVMFGGDVAWAFAVRRTFRNGGRAGRITAGLCYAFIVVMSVALVAMMIGRMLNARLDAFVPTPVAMTFFVWHFIGLAVALISGVVHSAGVAGARLAERSHQRAIGRAVLQQEPIDLGRRDFLARATVLAPVIVTAGATGVAAYELGGFRVRELNVPIANLPSGIDGMTIAHLSDVHLGQFTTQAAFRRIVAAANDLDADLVLQTGDLINYDQRDLPVAAELSHALRGRFGQFMCEGNHDLIQGRESFERFCRGARLPILINEAADVQVNNTPLCILGLPWLRPAAGESLDAAHVAAVAKLAAKRTTGAFSILLAHHPHAFDAAAASGIPLTLSGHTHGGQLNLSHRLGFGSLMYRYWSGLYQKDAATCVVSNGVGNWFPLRVNAPAEIVRLTLRRA